MSLDGVDRVLYHHRTQGKAVEGVHIRGIADALKKESVAVDILSLPGADPYASPNAMSPQKQATHLMKWVARLPEALFEMAEIAYNAIIAYRMLGYFKRHRDVTFIYERYALFTFITVLIGRWRKLPVILEVNDSAVVARVRPLKMQWLATFIERWVFNRADGLVFVSDVFRQRALAAHGSLAPSIVTPNAANIDQFSFTTAQRDDARRRYGLEGAVVCGYLGAFVPWHAIDRFVEVIAGRLAEAPHLKLLLVGDGATFAPLQAFIAGKGLQDRIVMTGRVPHGDVPGLLAAMDLAVLPSAGDYTSPVKLFEFMACGIAPIAPAFEPIREVLTEDANGWMFPAGRLEAAADIVIARSRDPEALQRVGQAARQYIHDHRQWRHNVLQLVDLYRRVRRPSPRVPVEIAS